MNQQIKRILPIGKKITFREEDGDPFGYGSQNESDPVAKVSVMNQEKDSAFRDSQGGPALVFA